MLSLPDQPAGIMFHHFHGSGFPKSQGSMTADDLDRLICAIPKGRLLDARDWIDRAACGSLEPQHLCLTFDDNLSCQFEVALPVIVAHGIKAAWFVNTDQNANRLEIYRHFRNAAYAGTDGFFADFVFHCREQPAGSRVDAALKEFDHERYLVGYTYLSASDKKFRFVRDRVLQRHEYDTIMDAMMAEHGVAPDKLASMLWLRNDDIRKLSAAGHEIGLHSHTHPTFMEALPEAEQREEYSKNQICLMELYGSKCRAMAHPCNSYSERTLEVLRDLGVSVGFRANMEKSNHGALEWPRHNHAVLMSRLDSHSSAASLAPRAGQGMIE